MSVKLLVGTRKGLFHLSVQGDTTTVDRVSHAGVPVPYAFRDPRSGKLYASLDHGHWGTKLSRSDDNGKTWLELPPPTFPKGEVQYDAWAGPNATKPAKIDYLWYMATGGDDQPGRVWFGTNPGGLFVSDDHGDTLTLVRGLWDHPSRPKWTGGGRDTPGIHSIIVDPRDSQHVYVGISCAGVLETTDGGTTWHLRNQGLLADFLPDPTAEVGQDPHFVALCAAHPDVLWQQNHCGIWRSADGGASWDAIHEEQGPAKFGFPVAVHPTDPDTAWVVPAISDEKRMTDGVVRVCRTRDGGQSWQALTQGLPVDHAYDLVYRHALDIAHPTLAFGSTTGNLFLSQNEGDEWSCVHHHLPPIYSVRFE